MVNSATTLVGLLVLCAAAVSVFTNDKGWSEVALLIPSIIALIYADNKKAIGDIKSLTKKD